MPVADKAAHHHLNPTRNLDAPTLLSSIPVRPTL